MPENNKTHKFHYTVWLMGEVVPQKWQKTDREKKWFIKLSQQERNKIYLLANNLQFTTATPEDLKYNYILFITSKNTSTISRTNGTTNRNGTLRGQSLLYYHYKIYS